MAGILTLPSTAGAGPVPAGPVAPSATAARPLVANPQLGRNPMTGAVPPPPGGAPPPGQIPTPTPTAGDLLSASPQQAAQNQAAQAMHASPTINDALRAAWNPAIPSEQPGMLGPVMAQQQARVPPINFVQPRQAQMIRRST